ncbi:MAG: hypothetical protein EOP56_15030 [Sphingobacteriales bacterium]|nr:MAG: hypothetical protein EOP56_15030 [Sphingobacteriales bacterium]
MVILTYTSEGKEIRIEARKRIIEALPNGGALVSFYDKNYQLQRLILDVGEYGTFQAKRTKLRTPAQKDELKEQWHDIRQLNKLYPIYEPDKMRYYNEKIVEYENLKAARKYDAAIAIGRELREALRHIIEIKAKKLGL